jgi:hypothetical protein
MQKLTIILLAFSLSVSGFSQSTPDEQNEFTKWLKFYGLHENDFSKTGNLARKDWH